jgi:hypothetical protein
VQRSPSIPCRAVWCLAAACGGLACAAEPSPAVLADFTRRVQPLLVNACAAGACHGGPAAPAPRLARPVGGTMVDRRMSQANLHAFLEAVGPERDPQPLVSLLARRHPASGMPEAFAARPLTGQQRRTIETWLEQVRADERRVHHDPQVRLASGAVPEPVLRPNRFRTLLDEAANPPTLPPPQQPQGLIFGPIEQPPADP